MLQPQQPRNIEYLNSPDDRENLPSHAKVVMSLFLYKQLLNAAAEASPLMYYSVDLGRKDKDGYVEPLFTVTDIVGWVMRKANEERIGYKP